MVSSLFWKLRVFSRRLWVRALLISAVALVAAAIAPVVSPQLPARFTEGIDREAVRGLLDILTNSMLAVATFSLSIMVTAHLSADKGVTPRTHRMLQEDTRTQTVLATFVGSFIYALTQILLINAGLVAEDHYPVIYLFTVVVIALVVIALVRWIAHLSGLGSVEATTRRVEERAKDAIRLHLDNPTLGGAAMTDPEREVPDDAHVVHSTDYGFVQHIDIGAISDAVEEWNGKFYLTTLPGEWINAGEPLGHVAAGKFDDEKEAEIRAAITIGDVRGAEQDPGHSLIVLTEIAERALSPGINDPRTAMDIVSRLVRLTNELLSVEFVGEPSAPRVFVPPLNVSRLMQSAFDPIARDGRGFYEVQYSIQSAYQNLSRHRNRDVAEAARVLSRRALAYAEDGLLLEEDLERIRALATVDGSAPKRGEDASLEKEMHEPST